MEIRNVMMELILMQRFVPDVSIDVSCLSRKRTTVEDYVKQETLKVLRKITGFAKIYIAD
jgi:hypothetical protein